MLKHGGTEGHTKRLVSDQMCDKKKITRAFTWGDISVLQQKKI